ncbi:MAG: ABC transporter ATP-binding protein [Deltaproteobacteria bacterium]|jgi:branched-chain amino acid transport system ATP-binding protein|nr:ABC transporter ATP-binding protein [Deltaproteobacteria bacterium]MDA8305657.1 ABC transporter ATP-binding protein [Deltaproteobacteria bacterium]
MCPNGKHLLKVEGLVKKFGGFRALNGVNIDVREGQIVGLAGPNGSGKTTLINVISGVYRPDGGSVEFDGRSVYKLPSHKIVRMGINRTFQVPKPLAGLTVWENVKLGAVYGSREGNRRETVRQALEIVQLHNMKDSVSADLTFAQQKLLGLATALATKPKMLLVDEIAAGLSHQELLWIAEMLLRIQKTGVAMIVVEHHLGFIDTLTSDVVVMNAGANLFRGSIQEAAQNDEVVEVFLGR